MKQWLRLTGLLIFLGMAGSCNKWYNAPQVMPPETRKGAHTFGCYVDGKLFLPAKKTAFIFGRSPLTLSGYDDHLTLYASNETTGETFYFHMNRKDLARDKRLPYIHSWDTTGAMARYLVDGRELNTYRGGPGVFHITRYTDSVIAGTFWFDAVDTVTHDTVRVRDGRFDMER